LPAKRFEIFCVVDAGADDGARSGDTCVGQLCVGEPDNSRTGFVQLLDNRRGKRVVTADNDVAVEPVVHHKHPLLLALTDLSGNRPAQ
jgi:hypothetical protein